ncbi:MAG TPA: histidine kinase [Kofleriaceae bacterium]|nr:histidine kinase [Kofleriaceae bacterium]
MAIGIPSRKQHAIGVAVLLAFVLAPSAARALAGQPDTTVGLVAFFAAVVIVVPVTLALGLALGERRALSTTRTIALAYGLAAVSGAVLAVIALAFDRAGVLEFDPGATLLGEAIKGAYLAMAMVGLWGMLVLLPRAVADARARERERADLRREIERARVRAALEPHFVLNTLNAISGLVGDDPDTARELVGDLGDLLRDVVAMAEREVQSAADEVAWLKRYARILAARHAGRLVVEWSIDPAAAAIAVPVLLLQPLVENAIQHGALQRPGGGTVKVELRVADRALRCTIEDDGPGMAPELRDGARGLALTRRRLACDAPGSTLVIDSAPTGTRATVHLVTA